MTWVSVGLLGGVVGLDSTSFPQAMISRPLVAATLTGLLLGRPLDGFAIGLLLELFGLVILPVGAARHPESGTASVAATAAYATVAPPGHEAFLFLLAVGFGLGWERVTGASVVWLRQTNERWSGLPPARDACRNVERRHLAAMGLDFARSAAVVVAGTFVGAWLLGVLDGRWALGTEPIIGMLAVAGTAMLGATLPLFGGWEAKRFSFTFGLLCGSLLLILRWLG